MSSFNPDPICFDGYLLLGQHCVTIGHFGRGHEAELKDYSCKTHLPKLGQVYKPTDW